MKNEEKTHTTLYLNKNLVKIAKEIGINISKVVNKELEKQIRPLDLAKDEPVLSLSDLEGRGGYILPQIISELKLINIGQFEEEEFNFEEGLNVIYGYNGSGKTTIINSIAEAIRYKISRRDNALRSGADKGKIELSLVPRNKIKLNYKKVGDKLKKTDDVRCFLLDDVDTYFDKSKREEIIDLLRNKFRQIIISTSNEEIFRLADNIVDLEGNLKKRKKELTELKEKLEDIEEKIEKSRGRIEEHANLKEKLKKGTQKKDELVEKIEITKELREKMKKDEEKSDYRYNISYLDDYIEELIVEKKEIEEDIKGEKRSGENLQDIKEDLNSLKEEKERIEKKIQNKEVMIEKI